MIKAMAKKEKTIQEIDWENHLRRLRAGFINRQQERRSKYPKRKRNCRKYTLGRIKYYREFGQNN